MSALSIGILSTYNSNVSLYYKKYIYIIVYYKTIHYIVIHVCILKKKKVYLFKHPMFRYPTVIVYKVSVYYLDPLNFRYFFLLNLISALLRDLQKMAASKPISWLFLKKTSLISLNNNFGTLNSCSGLFPFRHTRIYLLILRDIPLNRKFYPFRHKYIFYIFISYYMKLK